MPEEKTKKLDVSVVVCAKNAEKNIAECLKSVKENNPKEIILVDGNSSDKTVEFAKPCADIIVKDPGLGLAVARNYGLKKVTAKYVCNVGPDNILPPGTLKNMADYLEKNNLTGVSTQTIIKDAKKSYFSYALNLYKKSRFYPGLREVIGTPHLFISDVLKKNNFDDKMSWSDDSDICARLSKMGCKFGIADAFVWEIGTEDLDSIKRRWYGYGLSDFEFYKKYSASWSFERKILSVLHPVKAEFIGPLLSPILKISEKIKIIPFLLLITGLRYFSWIKNAIKKYE